MANLKQREREIPDIGLNNFSQKQIFKPQQLHYKTFTM